MGIRSNPWNTSAKPPLSEPTNGLRSRTKKDNQLKDLNNQRFEKNPLIAWRLIDGVVLLVPIKQPGPEISRLYRLQDPVSATIW